MPKNLSEIQIKEVMTTKIVAAQADDSVLDVARAMLEKDFDGIPIVDEKNKLIGLVTMKELLDNEGLYLPTVVEVMKGLRVTHQKDVTDVNKNLEFVKNLKVVSIMNPKPEYVAHNTTLDKVAEAFVRHHVEQLPVVDSFKTLVGIVTKHDVLKALVTPFQPLSAHTEFTIEPEPLKVVSSLKKEFVVVSRARARFWYIALFVFLALGIVVALALILRIRIV